MAVRRVKKVIRQQSGRVNLVADVNAVVAGSSGRQSTAGVRSSQHVEIVQRSGTRRPERGAGGQDERTDES